MSVGTEADDTRKVVESFCDLFYEQGRVGEAFRTYVSEGYRQHNPMADDGRENAILMLEGMKQAFPGFTVDVKRIAVDNDLAFVHSHARMTPGEAGMAVVDIFRVENGVIVEHWDVMQPVPAESANKNTMF